MSRLFSVGSGNGPHRVFVAVPAYSEPCFAFHASLLESLPHLHERGYLVNILTGYCHVDDARNFLVREFLKSDCSDLVFIDADTGWSAQDLLQLLSYDRDVVAGVVPLKHDAEQYSVRLLPGEIWSDEDGLIEVEGIGTAFLRIRRNVLEALSKEAQTYIEPRCESRTPLIFERGLLDGRRLSGDYAFCRKWRARGGRIFIDPELKSLTHTGQKSWAGCFGAYLRRTNGLPIRGLDRVAGEFSIEDARALLHEWGNADFSASPELLMACAELAKASTGPILEFGSGLSTLCMAAANPRAEIHAIEHDERWFRRLQDELTAQKIVNVTVHLCPLRDGWYDADYIPRLNYTLTVIDGPPRDLADRTAVLSRWALSGAVVIDDVTDAFQTWAEAQGRTFAVLGDSRPFMVST